MTIKTHSLTTATPTPFLLSHLLYACHVPDTASLWVYQVDEIECCLSPGGAGSLVMETDM